MRVLLCHNYYQEPGGEDQVFADEEWLLKSWGHEVVRYTLHNEQIDHVSRLRLACKTLWNRQSYRELRQLIREARPALMHCHNNFPLISPSCYAAARSEGIAVIQTLHNFRLLCPSGLFLRKGWACEDCLRRTVTWPAVLHRCYRRDWKASGLVTVMLGVHRALGTWSQQVDRYIALSAFSRRKFIEGGLPARRVVAKPNFMRLDPEPGAGDGGYALFVGRLSQEKGTMTLLSAWEQLGDFLPLKIVGDGPLVRAALAASQANPRIECLGQRSSQEVLSLMGQAACLIFPSVCYENCPKVILEAYAKGTPVIGSRLGSIAEMIDDGRTGLLFEPGSAGGLATKVREFFCIESRAAFRRAARHAYEAKYTAARAYRSILDIYAEACHNSGLRTGAPAFGDRRGSWTAYVGDPQ